MKNHLKSLLLGLGIISIFSLVTLLFVQFPVLIIVATLLISGWALGVMLPLGRRTMINHIKSFLLGLGILSGFIGLGVAASYFPIVFLVLAGIFFSWVLGTIVRCHWCGTSIEIKASSFEKVIREGDRFSNSHRECYGTDNKADTNPSKLDS
jgi:hypothetical protein